MGSQQFLFSRVNNLAGASVTRHVCGDQLSRVTKNSYMKMFPWCIQRVLDIIKLNDKVTFLQIK